MVVQELIDVTSTSEIPLLETLKDYVSIHVTEKEINTTFPPLKEPEVEFEINCSPAQVEFLSRESNLQPSIIRLDLPPTIARSTTKLIEAWSLLTTSHHVLRTTIVKAGAGKQAKFQQRVHKTPKYDFSSSLQEFELLHREQGSACLVLNQHDENSTVYLYLPPGVADRTSLGYIWKDLLSLLTGETLSPRRPFPEYCEEVSKRSSNQAKDFWANTFDRQPATVLHCIPLERHNRRRTTALDGFMTINGPSIRRFSKAFGVSVHGLIYTAFGIMLNRHCQSSSDTVIFAVEGRDKVIEGHNTVVGFADQEYPLKIQLNPGQPVAEAIREIERFNAMSSSNAFIGYETVKSAQEAAASDFKIAICEDDTAVGPVDDQFTLSVTVHLGRLMSISACHDTAIPSKNVEVLLNHFVTALLSIVSEPFIPLNKVNIIPPDEQSLIMEMSRPLTQPVYDNVHKLFERQVALTPDTSAIQFEGDAPLSYDNLNRIANRVARQLPVSRGSFVPTGAAYVTLDPDTPQGRNQFIVNNVDAKVVIVDRTTASRFPNEVVIEDIIENSRQARDTNLTQPCDPSDPVYVIYTSGSTGKPKGVLHRHSSATSGLSAFPTLPNLRQLLFHNPVFSAAQRSIWSTLKQGGCLCLASKDNLTIHIGRTINQMQINVIDVTPSTALLLTPGTVPCLRRMTVAGELINPALIPMWVNELELLNAYGLSENTQVNWRREMVLGQNPQNIGRPSDTTTSFILYPGTTELCPLLVPGELCLGGDQLADYYINRPEKTAESFFKNPFGPGRLYKTGDMVVAHENGSIEMVGRIDFQVKINDQRVEPGDSNTIIQMHPDVLNSSVVAVHVSGRNALVAVIVAKGEDVEWSELRNELKDLLKQHIPSYMIPTYWVLEEELPLNVNGKVDIPRLANHVQSLGREYLLQSSAEHYHYHHTPIELSDGDAVRGKPIENLSSHGLKLRDIVAEILHLPHAKMDTQSTFQELGGSSLDAIRVSARAYEDNFELVVSDLLRTPLWDLLNQAKHMEGGAAEAAPAPFSLLPSGAMLNRDGVEDAYPTTPLQDVFLADSLRGNTTYVYRRYYRVKGRDINALKTGLERLSEQSPILRTTFVLNKTSFLQVIRKTAPLIWEHLDITAEEFSSQAKRPAELAGNFVYFTYLRDDVLAVTMHHALFDHWSHDFLVDDLTAILREQPLQTRPSPAHFMRYLKQQNQDELRDFWKANLEGSHPCVLGHTTNETRTDYAELGEDVQAFASAKNVSIGALIYATWAIVLSLHTNQNDLVFGTTFSGRDVAVPGILRISGPTITTAPFRTKVSSEVSLIDLVREIQNGMWECAPRAQLGLRSILSASGQSATLFDTMVNILIKDSESSPERHADILERIAPFEPNYLDYTMLEAIPGTRNIELRILSCLPKNKAEYLLGNVVETLKAILRYPTLSVKELCPVSPKEQAFVNSLSTIRPTEPGLFAHSLFERAVARYTNKTALQELSGGTMSYGDLNTAADRLARRLQAMGIRPGVVIPICMKKSIKTLVAVFGILKAGAAFTPLDPKNPKDRNDFIVRDIAARVAIADSAHCGIFDRFPGEVINLDAIGSGGIDDNKEITVSELAPSDMAYIIYTSGSTGQPKGVQVSHGAVAASTEGMIEACKVDHQWHVLWFLNYVFDASYFDVFTVLSSGGTISIADQDTLVGDLAFCVNTFGVTQLMLTPTISKLISPDDVPTLKTLLVCGEHITPEVAEVWASRMDVYNGYGPTEATILMTVCKVTPSSNLKSIGYPLKAVRASILHPELATPVPYGTVGELCVSGVQVAIGYLNRPEITAAVFQTAEDGSVVYRTGDYARWLSNGEIECLGRKDNQIKLNGFRIELGEIEHAILSQTKDLVQGCVVGIPLIQDKKQIVVYYVPHKTPAIATNESEHDHMYPGAIIEPSKILERLTALAHYMIPKVFLPFRFFPLLPSGKVNRKALDQAAGRLSPGDFARYSGARSERGADFLGELSETEMVLQAAWANLFDVSPESIIPPDLFYNYGGDSIAAINLVSVLRRQGYSLSVNDVVTYPSLREQATRLKPIKAAVAQAVEFVVRGSVYQTLREAGVAEDDIEDIYPCAPGQVEFLTQGHTEDQFWQLMTLRSLPREFDFSRWVDLTRKLTEANQILRAMYLKQDKSDPLSWVQVILKKPVLDMTILECHTDNEKAALIRSHWDHRFEVGRPFVRYLVLKYPDGTMDLCTKLDHAMYDGTLLRIFDDQFEALRNNLPMPQSTPFKTFIDYTQQNRSGMLSFWQEYLKGVSFQYPAQIPDPKVSAIVGTTIDIPVNAFAQTAGVTASIIFQTAYSLLLHKIGGGSSSDIVYDYLLTGRNVDMDEPQLINGTCANFLPFRSRVATDAASTTIPALLRDTQSMFWKITENGLVGLGDIYHALEGKTVDRPPWAAKTLFLFQPFEPAVGEQSHMRWIVMAMSKVTMFVNYAIMFEVFKDVQGHRLKMGYDARAFSADEARAILDLYIHIVKDMVTGRADTVGELLDQIPFATRSEQ